MLSTKFFKSNFSKGEVQNLFLMFENGYAKLKDVSTTLSSNTPNQDKLVYLFYYPSEGRTKINTKTFSESLVAGFKSV